MNHVIYHIENARMIKSPTIIKIPTMAIDDDVWDDDDTDDSGIGGCVTVLALYVAASFLPSLDNVSIQR